MGNKAVRTAVQEALYGRSELINGTCAALGKKLLCRTVIQLKLGRNLQKRYIKRLSRACDMDKLLSDTLKGSIKRK